MPRRISFSRNKSSTPKSTVKGTFAREEPSAPKPAKSTFFRTTEVGKLLVPAGSYEISFLDSIKTPLVWSPWEANTLLLNLEKCQFQIQSDPNFSKFVNASSARWQAAMSKHNQVYLRLRECMITLKSLYKRRVNRDRHYHQEYILCGTINLAWAKLSDTFDPYVLRYYYETEQGRQDPTKQARLDELEKRVSTWAKLKKGLIEIGVTKGRDPRMNHEGW